ncbi:MAG: nucleotidyltransferase domain-containing protein [Candidatus Thermoplasmatota archaeon]|nr:nucleotidyltransferase domain-containing protein [Candidatus Thermoplasmatota archaeon]
MIIGELILRAILEKGKVTSYELVTTLRGVSEKNARYKKELYIVNTTLRRLTKKGLLYRVWTKERRGMYVYKPTKKAIDLYLPTSEIAKKRLISERLQAEAKKLTKGLVLHPKIRKNLHLITLFGSAARGVADEKSDVDVLIVINDNKIRPLIEDLALDYYMKHGIRFSSQILARDDFIKTVKKRDAATMKIFREGIVLYGKDHWKELKELI